MKFLRNSYLVEIEYSNGIMEQRLCLGDTPDCVLHNITLMEQEHCRLHPDLPKITKIVSLRRRVYGRTKND